MGVTKSCFFFFFKNEMQRTGKGFVIPAFKSALSFVGLIRYFCLPGPLPPLK